jgi:DNA-binding transcriptional MerR regulator
MVAKSQDAFRTISEVSEELNVPPHVLRFWEKKFSSIKPMTRGGGRRFYRPNDIKLLKSIHKLLYTDMYTISGVQNIFRQKGKAYIVALYDNTQFKENDSQQLNESNHKDEYRSDLFEENQIKSDPTMDFKNFLQDSLKELNEMENMLKNSYI